MSLRRNDGFFFVATSRSSRDVKLKKDLSSGGVKRARRVVVERQDGW